LAGLAADFPLRFASDADGSSSPLALNYPHVRLHRWPRRPI